MARYCAFVRARCCAGGTGGARSGQEAERAPPVITAESRSGAHSEPWWQNAVFYEVHREASKTPTPTVIGDLAGSRRGSTTWRFGYRCYLITPFYPSPQVDFGYDIRDYENVDPQFGTLADFDRLVTEAHRRGIKIVADVVLNHTSDQHPWFVLVPLVPDVSHVTFTSGATGETADHRPTGRRSSSYAWTLDPATGQYYITRSTRAARPELGQPQGGAGHVSLVRFWLDRGVDGLRLDAIRHMYEDPQLRDNALLPELRRGSKTEHEQDLPQYGARTRTTRASPEACARLRTAMRAIVFSSARLTFPPPPSCCHIRAFQQ